MKSLCFIGYLVNDREAKDFAWLGVLKMSKKPGEAWGNLSIHFAGQEREAFRCSNMLMAAAIEETWLYVSTVKFMMKGHSSGEICHTLTSLCRETSSPNKGVHNGKDQRRRNSITYVKKLAFQRWPCNPLLY